jgi:hypothetical protein
MDKKSRIFNSSTERERECFEKILIHGSVSELELKNFKGVPNAKLLSK